MRITSIKNEVIEKVKYELIEPRQQDLFRSLEDLASFKQDGRRIGQKKAEAIINLLHSERPSKN